MNHFNFPPPTLELANALLSAREFRFRQIHELAELFGFETRNRYALQHTDGRPVAYAAEQQKGFWGFVSRQFLGHWRRFDIHVYNEKREEALILKHPFRWFFQRLEIFDASGAMIGAIQQRFAFITKSFDVEDARGKVRYQVRSGFFKFWTFELTKHGREVATVRKVWSGLFTEAFTDKDNFQLLMDGPNLDQEDRILILAAALFVDLQYFERKARR